MRSEKLEFRMRLDKSQVANHQNDIDLILKNCGRPTSPQMQDEDTLSFTYSILIQYFGSVSECLAALERILCDESVVVGCEHVELSRGRCLIESVLARIQAVESRLAKASDD